MKYLNEFADYLIKEGYKDKYYGSADGYLTDVDFYDKYNNYINIQVEAIEEFDKYLKEHPNTDYEIDYKNYIVNNISFKSTITTEPNYYDSSIGFITLVKNTGYHKHGLDLFEKCVQLQKQDMIAHELFIMSKHIEHLKWAKEVLIPLLKQADYIITYSSIFDLSNERFNSNLIIEFQHYNEEKWDAEFKIETDCITGDFLVTNNLPIYGKTKEEVWNILVEDYWKKLTPENYRKRFSYLYTEGETKDTYKKYLNELFNTDCFKS